MFSLKSERAGAWGARGVIIAVAILHAWYTWGHWGDTQIDSGREMYVPVDLLRGKLLYRDIWYQYGPLPPYAQALAFLIFGINLSVLYAFGLILVTSSSLLLFETAREFELVLPAAMAPAIFLLAESYRPAIFNFIFPYSYSATIAATIGLAFLYFTIQHALTGRLRWLIFAALCASLVLLTKQEFAIACLAVLGFEAIASCLNNRSWSALTTNVLASAAGLMPALLGYGILVWKISAKTIFIDNWVMTPGTYTMRTIGARRMALEGFRFGLNEWTGAAVGAALSLALWFAIGHANTFAIKKLGLSRLRSFVVVVVMDIAIAMIVIGLGTSLWAGLPALVAQIVFPKGMYLIACLFMILAVWKVWRTQGRPIALAEAALGIYAVVVSIRVIMEMSPTGGYAVFFNGTVFLVFAIVVARVVAYASRSLDLRRRDLLVGCMLGAEAVLLVIGFFPRRLRSPLIAPLKTPLGTIYTQPDRAVLFPQIMSFMKTHTRNGMDILVVPESPSLYFFSEMQSPSRWYEVQPGVLNPEQEQQLISDADSAHVQFVLLCNRHTDEFFVGSFGTGYDKSIYDWMGANFTKVGQFGPRTDLLPASMKDLKVYQPYVIEIYERKSAKTSDR